MAKYIEKNDLLKVLPPKCNMGDMYATAYNTCLNTIENLIKEHPTADVVPVEWISVKDRLPENDVRVLVAVDSDKSDTKIDTDRMIYKQWVRWGMSVTHWMPLPEPPKKEGASNESNSVND